MTDWAKNEFKTVWQPQSGKEAQAKGWLPGVQEAEKQPGAVVPSAEGVFIEAVGAELARL